MCRVVLVGVLLALALPGRADEKPPSAEEVQKLVSKGGKYWSSLEKPSGNSMDIGNTKVEDKPGKRLWLWPAKDQVYDVVDGKARVKLRWYVRPGQKQPNTDEEFPVIQFTDEPRSFGLSMQFPGVKLTPRAAHGECEAELSFDKEKSGEQRLGFVLQEASNAVKVRAKKKAN
jgi:hypothetical protein